MPADSDERPSAWDAQQHLASIVESSHDAIISKGLDGIIVSWNRAAERLFGYSSAEAIGQPITLIIPAERATEEVEIISKVRSGERIEHFETVRRRKDGQLIELSITVSPVRDIHNKIIGASKIARDISERRRAEEQRELLLGEMSHRTKNFAAVIDAIARQSRPKDNAAAAEVLDTFVNRLRALMVSGELVVGSTSRKAPLGELFRQILEPFENPNEKSAITMEGPALEVSEQTAGGLALAVHELATNALKYGALKSSNGRINLRWDYGPNKLVLIEWKERGGLRPLTRPTRVGFGTRVIRTALSHDKQASTAVVFEPDGVRATFLLSPEPAH